MSERHYTYRAEWSPEDGEYVGLVAEFPSLSWLAPNAADAILGIERVVGEVIVDMTASGETVPAPLADRRYSGKIVLRISPDLHRRLTVEAAEQGVSLNQWINQKISADTSPLGGLSVTAPPEWHRAKPRSVLPDGFFVINPPPTPEDATLKMSDAVDFAWRMVRNAFVHGRESIVADDDENFLPGGEAPAGAQILPDGTVLVFGKAKDGRYKAYAVPGLAAIKEV